MKNDSSNGRRSGRSKAEPREGTLPDPQTEVMQRLYKEVPIGLCHLDTDLRYVHINDWLAALNGLKVEDHIGRTIGEVLPHIAEFVEPQFRHVIETGEPILGGTVDAETPAQPGVIRSFRHNYVAARSIDGTIVGVSCVVEDITDRKKLDRMKSEFISTVSHELRTPLTSIMGSLGLVVGGTLGTLPDRAKAMVEVGHKNTLRLINLVNDILDMEKLESGTLVFNFQPLDLSQLVTDSVVANKGFADEYGVEFVTTEMAPGMIVHGDDNRLTQAVANLLSNAAKFSPIGRKIEVSVARQNSMARVAVADHGPGIPEEYREHIFERFVQADSSDTRQKGGTGLGLGITKSIVEKHGGNIGFDTKEGDGATFFFTLPTQE